MVSICYATIPIPLVARLTTVAISRSESRVQADAFAEEHLATYLREMLSKSHFAATVYGLGFHARVMEYEDIIIHIPLGTAPGRRMRIRIRLMQLRLRTDDRELSPSLPIIYLMMQGPD
jgi:hypothetical protein